MTRSFGPLPTSSPSQADELSSSERPRRRESGRSRGRSFSVRAMGILIVILCLGLPGSYLASWYSHREGHQAAHPTGEQYRGYLAGFGYLREHPKPDGVADSDFCDAAAHRLNRTAGKWLYFSTGCQEATGWTPGDPPLRPLGKADFLRPQ